MSDRYDHHGPLVYCLFFGVFLLAYTEEQGKSSCVNTVLVLLSAAAFTDVGYSCPQFAQLDVCPTGVQEVMGLIPEGDKAGPGKIL